LAACRAAPPPVGYQLGISATMNGQTVSAPPVVFHVSKDRAFAKRRRDGRRPQLALDLHINSSVNDQLVSLGAS
jgi:hypothetical protein